MWRIACLLLLVLVVSPPVIHPNVLAQQGAPPALRQESQQPEASQPETLQQTESRQPAIPADDVSSAIEAQLEGPLDSAGITAANQWVSSLGLADWMGPLAPVALSPFFGVTLLSGLALWGPEWVTDNALIGSTSALRSPMLFWIFLGLTILTSVPRFTKVSKPLAQAVDRLEAYSVIVILLTVKLAASSQGAGEAPVAMVQLGVISMTMDALIAIAMIINILIVNSVKFFFEFMVWLTPIPLLDAVFEVCNKSICAALIAIYAFSPTIATVINLMLLLMAAIVIRWTGRRVRFYRTILLDPVLAWLLPPYGRAELAELIVFPKSEIGPFVAKSRLKLYRSEGEPGGWTLQEASWWRLDRKLEIPAESDGVVHLGWVMHQIDFMQNGRTTVELNFSRRYEPRQLREILEELRLQLPEAAIASPPSPQALRAEFT